MKEFFKKLFAFFATKPAVDKSTQPVETAPAKPDPIVKPGMLTREQLNDLYLEICFGVKKISFLKRPYVLYRETAGKNRSTDIDSLITRQGGKLGQAYCQYGQQDSIDAIAEATQIPRKLFDYPEGGGTQKTIERINKKYVVNEPNIMCLTTWQYNNGDTGHIEMIVALLVGFTKNFGFNTDIDGDDKVVRDGQGCGYTKRNTLKSQYINGNLVEVKAYVDFYAIYADAFNKNLLSKGD